MVALARVRTTIAQREERKLRSRLVAFWQDLIIFHRRALAGVVVAMGLGALSAPFVVMWAGRHINATNPTSAAFAGVIIESMEWGGTKQAVVRQSGDHSTTLIWVEPDATATDKKP